MYKKKKILAVVLARSGSKGIKNKNLKKINNLSLVGHVGLFIKKIKIIDKRIISTNSKKIGKEGKKFNLDFIFDRPKYLSGPKVSDELVLNHALIATEKLTKQKFDVIVSFPPTSPLRKMNDVILSIKRLIDKKYDAVWTVSNVDSKFHPFKSLIIRNKKLSFFSEMGKKIKYRQQLSKTYFRNGACYVFSRKTVLKKRILTKNTGFVISKTDQISIDDINDLNIARKIMKN